MIEETLVIPEGALKLFCLASKFTKTYELLPKRISVVWVVIEETLGMHKGVLILGSVPPQSNPPVHPPPLPSLPPGHLECVLFNKVSLCAVICYKYLNLGPQNQLTRQHCD